MPFPDGWPPPGPSGVHSLRVYISATATANFADRAYLFSLIIASVQPQIVPMPTIVPGVPTTGIHSPMGGGDSPGRPDMQGPGNHIPPVKGQRWSHTILIANGGGAVLEFSFDGVNVHGVVEANTVRIYERRFEAGIALRGSSAFRVEAW